MDHTPLYIRIKDYILENINAGKLKPGDKIPSEKELGELFNVSRITASTAVRDLMNDGIVYRIQGKGTFISSNREENIESHSTFGFDAIDGGIINEGEHITKDVSEIKADAHLSSKLNIDVGDSVFRILRTKVIDGVVYAAEYVYLPAYLYPSFNIKNVKSGLIFDIVKECCRLEQKRAKVYIRPIIVTDADAELLGVARKTPVLMWEKKTYSSEEKVIEYSENIINTTVHSFYLEF